MKKIKKGLSDAEMFKGVQEEEKSTSLFDLAREFDAKEGLAKQKEDKKVAHKANSLSFTEQKELERALFDLKLHLYQSGIMDYTLKIKNEGTKIVIQPVVKKKR